MSKHTKAKRREAFQTNALCAYGWSMDPIIDYRESRPDWKPPTGPSVTLDLDAPMERCPHCGDSYPSGPFAYGAHATIGCRVRRAIPLPVTLPYTGATQ